EWLRDTGMHSYAAEWAWYMRWQGQSPTALLPRDQFPDVASVRAAWSAHETNMRGYVDALGDDVGRVIDYTLLTGSAGSTPLWQMLQHLVNHASYHRGQITTMLRQIGARPGKPMDMI